MRAYCVQATDNGEVIATRYAGTAALSKSQRDELVTEFEVAKKNVTIEEVEIPMAKADLLVWINELSAKSDKGNEGE